MKVIHAKFSGRKRLGKSPLRSCGWRAAIIGVVLVAGGSLVASSGLAATGNAVRAGGYHADGPSNARARLGLGRGALLLERAAPVSPPGGLTVFTLPRRAGGRRIPSGFLGLSIESYALEAYAGRNPHAIDPVLVQLIRNLAPGQAPVLRIGGDSTDWTWWPIPHVARPAGVRYTLSPEWLRVTRALTHMLGADLILGVNLEADSQEVAVAEARALTVGLGRASIAALELGNEPDLYSVFGWYNDPNGAPVLGRPRGYDFNAFARDFSRFARVLPPGPLAGPAIGSAGWFPYLSRFLAAEPRVRIVTLHRYPLSSCFVPPTSHSYPTFRNLLATASSTGLAASVAPYVDIAHARHRPLRIDEINTDSCGRAPSVGHSFGSALWVLDTLFAMANVGVDGVNIHTYPGASYSLFRLRDVKQSWQASVAPEYYGMLMFAQAAPPGSTLLPISRPSGSPVRSWATLGREGVIRVVLINDGNRPCRVALQPSAPRAAATLEWLVAPSVFAKHGVTLGGRTFGSETETGQLTGLPRIPSVKPAAGRYLITLPAASAVMVTLPRGSGARAWPGR